MAELKQFTHIGVEKRTQRRVRELAAALDVDMYSLVAYWADQEWESAVKAGLVVEKKNEAPERNFRAMSAKRGAKRGAK